MDYNFDFYQNPFLRPLDIVYWVCAMCVVYKLIWIVSMVRHEIPKLRWTVTISAGALSIAVLAKALGRFDYGGDAASFNDIMRELSMCAFLFSCISFFQFKVRKKL
jgi:hypothetical protein